MTSDADRPPRTGGQILVDQLVAQGIRHATCVPGESYLAVLDALHDASSIDVLACRAEGGACMMAEAVGKLTGRPGVCFVTRGPGATNASAGVHVAMQDSTPLILFIGQVARGMRDREAFQEVDFRRMYGGLAKWVTEIDDARRIPEILAHAFSVSMQGRPGPVVIALPEDMLRDEACVADAPVVVPARAAPPARDMQALAGLLSQARAPLAILGGSLWTQKAVDQFREFAGRHGLPVATGFRRASIYPASDPAYAGDVGIGPDPRLRQRILDADVLLVIGSRMSEMASSSYTLLDIPSPRQKLVHVYPDARELGRVYQPALRIQSAPEEFCGLLASLALPGGTGWARSAQQAHQEYLDWSGEPRRLPGEFQYGEAVAWLRSRIGPDGFVANGAGNYAGWLHRHYRFERFGTQLAPTSGSMGYGVPAAIMAKRAHPDRISVGFAGDGCFLMTGQEFATAVQYDIPVVIVVVDNGRYGTIRMHQDREYPGRHLATSLYNPDFAALAKAYGGHGERVEKTADFPPAFERAVASGKPAILHCLLDPRAQSHARDARE